MRVYAQADPRWSRDQLGMGKSTIGKGGCLVACLAMAAEHVLGGTFLPSEVNRIATREKAFMGSLLILDQAAKALGLHIVERSRDIEEPTVDEILELTREALSCGGCAILHVDHNDKKGGDHFVLVHDRHEFGYLAADPAPGMNIKLGSRLHGVSNWAGKAKSYTPVGVSFISKDEK